MEPRVNPPPWVWRGVAWRGGRQTLMENAHIVFQTVGGAFTTSAAQAAFVNQLIAKLPSTAPTVDPALVISTGATQLREVFTPEELPGIILAYMHGLKAVFAVGIGIAGAACLCTAFIPWSRLPTHAPSAENNNAAVPA